MKLLKKSEHTASAPQEARDPREALLEHGIYLEWYAGMRLDEEITRATRYARPLSVLVARPKLLPGEQIRREAMEGAVASAKALSRSTDLVGWFGPDQLVFILPETEPADARVAALRWRSDLWRRSQHFGGQQWEVLVCDDWSHVQETSPTVEAALTRAQRVEAA
jgi:hypothetical protein